MAGFVRGQMTDSRSDAYEKGDGSRSGDSFSEWVYLYGQSHQRDALDGVALKKGFMAGFVRGQLTDSRSDAYEKGDAVELLHLCVRQRRVPREGLLQLPGGVLVVGNLQPERLGVVLERVSEVGGQVRRQNVASRVEEPVRLQQRGLEQALAVPPHHPWPGRLRRHTLPALCSKQFHLSI